MYPPKQRWVHSIGTDAHSLLEEIEVSSKFELDGATEHIDNKWFKVRHQLDLSVLVDTQNVHSHLTELHAGRQR